ncbi:gamma-glutamylputrescine oxidoreductase [Fusarium globosum]|uniref:Gamma-glutamylputrescine oxidoreductase n=1 Tax=Fusarium globosum TaxID=78864 RepID=A0A8H5Y3F4_9HYPO|nr:gamma-glutamylputrescine oxidoreductase [Fusarium globosum]
MCSASFPPPKGMPSFWRTEPGDLDNYRSTAELPPRVDVAIVGAGYSAAAILTHILATTSAEDIPSILVLKARQLCSGATGRNDPTREGILPQFLVPFPPNKSFVGRQDILASLRQELCLKRSYEVAALFGLGGAGKTQIALAYAHEMHEQNPDLSVFWVYAGNEERMQESYAKILEQFEIPRGENVLSDLELVKQWLESKHHKPWLMVVDNADDLNLFYGTDGLSRHLPTCPQGKLLVTTRNRQVAVRATKGRCLIEIPRMTESEAHDLLGEHLGFLSPDVTDLSMLASKLEYLPLILVQAASFIKENGTSINEYLSLLEADENLIELLDEDFETDGRYPDSFQAVTKAWAISFRQIRRQNQLAAELLSIRSMFDHQHIPERFLNTYLSLCYGEEKTLERLRAIGLLKAFSFVSSGEDNSISMHRLIQLVMRDGLSEKTQ